MDRVSTAGAYANVLTNLMQAQQSQVTAGNQVATQKKGTDLKTFASAADALTSMNSVQARLQTYQDQNTIIANRLTTQDTALNQVADSASAVRQAIASALATGSAAGLTQTVSSELQSAVSGMNTQYNGEYLFSGGQVNTKPVTVTQLSDLSGPVPIGGFFQNGDYKIQNKLDDSTTVTTGVLASDIGTQLLNAFQALQNSPVGPFNGQLTDVQTTWLQGQLAAWDQVGQGLTGVTAANGLVQQQVDAKKTSVAAQSTTLTGMLSSITDADMTQAASQLQLAQMSVEAAARVYQALQSSSLLNILPAA